MVFRKSVWCVAIAVLGFGVGLTGAARAVDCYWGCDGVIDVRLNTTEEYKYQHFPHIGVDGVRLDLYFLAFGNDLRRDDVGNWTDKQLCRYGGSDCSSQWPAKARLTSTGCIDDGEIRQGMCGGSS
jgi:hypothetical protein